MSASTRAQDLAQAFEGESAAALAAYDEEKFVASLSLKDREKLAWLRQAVADAMKGPFLTEEEVFAGLDAEFAAMEADQPQHRKRQPKRTSMLQSEH